MEWGPNSAPHLCNFRKKELSTFFYNLIEETKLLRIISFSYCIRHGGRALLADDMGLGKTLQALAVMSHYRTNWPLLVICPSSVKLTWAEVHACTLTLTVCSMCPC